MYHNLMILQYLYISNALISFYGVLYTISEFIQFYYTIGKYRKIFINFYIL